MVIAKWSYSSKNKGTYEGEVLGVKEDARGDTRLVIDPHTERQRKVYLRPNRLDNWDEIREDVVELDVGDVPESDDV